MKTPLLTGAAIAALTVGTSAAFAATKAEVLTTYVTIAAAKYEDSLITAKALQTAVDALIATPSPEALEAAKAAWKSARIPYQQTEVYRFGNAIVDDWEGKVNAWPLDEGLIDYVDASYGGASDENPAAALNVIANPQFTLSGQTIGAFYNSIRHSHPFSVGVNCALGGKQMRPYIEELSEIAECFVTCHPNAGLPNAFGGYDETPDDMAEILSEFARAGFVNLVGGCCGSTPDHIRTIAEAVRELAPREVRAPSAKMQLSGLEALSID